MPPLPVEVCQTILRHSIYVPGLFDPDAFEGDLMAPGFGDPGAGVTEESYWGAEKTRNILRRVFWAWNEYLLRFEHRLVNMSDVMHRRVDKSFLTKAIRISLDRRSSSCTELCVVPSSSSIYIEFATFCGKTILPFGFLPAEIIDISHKMIHYGVIAAVMGVFKQAKVLVSWKFFTSLNRPLFTPSLEHVHGAIHENIQYFKFINQSLVMVSFRLDTMLGRRKLVLELPSVRHLRIDYGNGVKSREYFEVILMPLLHKVGDQLLSLYIESWDRSYQMPVDIWEQCPNLEKFHPGMALVTSPPMRHPLHTLSVIPEHMSCTATLQWHNLRRLIFNGHWREIGEENVKDLISVWMTSTDGGVKVEDLDGVPLPDALEDMGMTLTTPGLAA